MCNLYRLTRAPAEVAQLFGARLGELGNFGPEGGEVYPGYPGLVLAPLRQAQGEREQLTLTRMTWGFPYAATGKSGKKLKPRPVNNARSDKLSSFLWRDSFAKRRCLIPLTAFAEAEGEAGAKTRTWFSLPPSSPAHPDPVEGPPVYAAAGLWRQTEEWGLAYTMVMTEACLHVADVHDRMPVILKRSDWHDWLAGPPDHASLLCRPYPEPMVVERTGESWVRR